MSVVVLPLMEQDAASQSSALRESAPGDRQAYTEEFKIDSVNQTADGKTKTYETTYLQAMDSHRRRMGMTIHYPETGNGTAAVNGSISDPENGTQTEWESRTKRAVVAKWPPVERRYGCWQTDEGRPRVSFGFRPSTAVDPQLEGDRTSGATSPDSAIDLERKGPVHEDLGVQTIKGVEAHGERWTWPASTDEAVDEKRPFITNEQWVAIDPRLLVRQVVEYPFKPGRTKTYSQDLVKLTMGEPDAEMFEPPEGYEIVTEEMHEVPCGRDSWPLP